MQLNKHALTLGLSLSVVLLVLSILYAADAYISRIHTSAVSASIPSAIEHEAVAALAPANSDKEESTPLFIIQLVSGELRMIAAASEGDFQILHQIDPRTLRAGDKEMLEKGIALYSQADLQVFLEDFGS